MADILGDGWSRKFKGTHILYGPNKDHAVLVSGTPGDIRAVMDDSPIDLVELNSWQDPTMMVYVDRRTVIAMKPVWSQFREKTGYAD